MFGAYFVMEYWSKIGESIYGNQYFVSSIGRVWSLKNQLLKTPPNQAVQTGCKIPTRKYLGWQFKILYDPKWEPQNKF